MGQCGADESAFEVARIDPGCRGKRSHPVEWVAGALLDEAEVTSTGLGPRIEGGRGQRPHAAELPEEHAHGDRPPPREIVQRGLKLGRRARSVRDGAYTTAVTLAEHAAQEVKTRGRLEVVPPVTATIEQGYEVIP